MLNASTCVCLTWCDRVCFVFVFVFFKPLIKVMLHILRNMDRFLWCVLLVGHVSCWLLLPFDVVTQCLIETAVLCVAVACVTAALHC